MLSKSVKRKVIETRGIINFLRAYHCIEKREKFVIYR